MQKVEVVLGVVRISEQQDMSALWLFPLVRKTGEFRNCSQAIPLFL